MSQFDGLWAAAASAITSSDITKAHEHLSQYVPESFYLRELADKAQDSLDQSTAARSKDTFATRNTLIAILICLRHQERITPDPTFDEDSVRRLAHSIANAISPVASVVNESEATVPDACFILQTVASHCNSTADAGLQAIEILTSQHQTIRLDDDVLLTLLSFTDDSESWHSNNRGIIATRVLEQQFALPGATPTKDQFLADTVLQRYLRPLFSRSKPASVTASGRKAEYSEGALSRGESMPDESVRTKPWKYNDLRAIPAVAWAVHEVQPSQLTQTWPLFVPVLLALADDPVTPVRRRGLILLADFLDKFPDRILRDTGLSTVFADSVIPTLSFLPSLTPEDESLQLLPPAYAALHVLAKKQQPPDCALLDKVLREGVFSGHFHAHEHVRIVEVLCQAATTTIRELGMPAVKHLKDLIPMLSSIMTDPFAPAAPRTLLAAVETLQAVLANCWPRISSPPWRDEIINALVLCWLHLAEHDRRAVANDDMEAFCKIETELPITARALAAVLKTTETDLTSHAAPLVEKEPRLAKLFASDH